MKKIQRKYISILVSTLFFLNNSFIGLTTAASNTVVQSTATTGSENYAQDEIIVKYKPGVDIDAVTTKHKGKIDKKNSKHRTSKIKIPKGARVKDEILSYQNDPAIEYAEPNYYTTITATTNDPALSSQWSIPKMKVDQAWNTTTGNNAMVVAILDTGVDTTHQDLAANLIPGYNAITDTTETDDDHGHGTHVAGIAAGVMNNGTGIAGVAGNSKILPVKVLGANGSGLYSDFGEGIYWAADHGAKVINMSLGGSSASQYLQDAVDYAYNKGCIVIAAAGNDNTSAPHYPAALNHVVAVAATDQNNAKAGFSNYGSHIDIAAPGVNILSSTYDGAYGYMQGTSMASPNVAGVAALVWSYRPTLTPGQLEAVLEYSATDLGAVGKDVYFGYGLIDAAKALTQQIDTSSVALNVTNVSPTSIAPGAQSKITYSLGKQAYVTLKIKNSSNTVVNTVLNRVLKAAGTQYIYWNGKTNTGLAVPSGDYTYEMQAEDTIGNFSGVMTGTITVDNTVPVVSGISVNSNPFAPNGSNNLDISYNISEAGKVTANIYNSSNTLVKSLASGVAQNPGANALQWNGKNSGNLIVPDGIYTIKIDAIDGVGLKAVQQLKTFTVEAADPVISLVSDTPEPFKVTGTSLSTIRYTLSENANVNIKVYDSSNNVVRTLVNGPITAGAKSITWNGKNDLGVLVPDGTYTYKINAVDAFSKNAVEMTGTITTDKTVPIISSYSANPSSLTDNNNVSINYNLSENAKVIVGIYNSSNSLVKNLLVNSLTNAGAATLSWDGKNSSGTLVGDGSYTYKINAIDLVGFQSVPVSGTIVVERNIPVISLVSDTPEPFKLTGTSLSTIKYTLSENANVNIKVYDSSNNVVKTLVNGPIMVGAKTVTWNGKNELGVLVPDGIYTYKINAIDSAGKNAVELTGTITTDKTIPVISGLSATPNPLTDASPVTFSYSASENVKVTIGVYNGSALVKTLQSNVLVNSGANSVTWDGKNSSGAYVSDGTYTLKVSAVDLVGFTATPAAKDVVVEKNNPTITNVTDSPDLFKVTGSSVNTIRYTLSEKATVSVKIYNSNGDLVRTLVNGVTLNSGSQSITWNGKNDLLLLVADGIYTYKIDATDMAGKTAAQYTGTITTDKSAPVISSVQLATSPFLSYNLSETSKVTIIIYNSSNYVVKNLVTNVTQGAGSNTINWNYTNNTNLPVPLGNYWFKITATDTVGFTTTLTGSFALQ